MDWRSDPLWNALATMRIEPAGATLGFVARLAREQCWTGAHADAVMEEYRRFLYLAATGGAPVTPSAAVDAAWHLHLTYSRHYWDILCGRIFGRPLHHDPTEGGAVQAEIHRGQYARTLERYRTMFGAPAPPEIWPDPARRSGRAAAMAAAVLLAAAGPALAANRAASAGAVALTIVGWAILLISVAASMVWVLARGGGGGGRKDDGCAGGFGCSGDGGGDGGHGCGGHGCGGGCGGH